MKARAAYARQAELLRDGVELSGTNVSYTFTRLNDLKPQMIAEANQNARRSAEQFARDSGASVGRIKTASQGYFSVGAARWRGLRRLQFVGRRARRSRRSGW